MDSSPTVKRNYSQLDETELEKEYIRLKEELKPIEQEMKRRHTDKETQLILAPIGLPEDVRKYIGDITASTYEDFVGNDASETATKACFRIDRLWVCFTELNVEIGSAVLYGCGIRFYNAEKRLFYALDSYDPESCVSPDACYLMHKFIDDETNPKNIRVKSAKEAKEKVLELTSNIDDSLKVIRNVIVACFRHLGSDSDAWNGVATSCAPEGTLKGDFEYLLGIPHEWDEETKRIGRYVAE